MRNIEFTWITINPNQMSGAPCIRGLCIPIVTVAEVVADGMTEIEILTAFPDLELEDIREALHYAAEVVRQSNLPSVATS